MILVPTDEQKVAIGVVIDNQFTKLNAFAGCSKTTTLTMVAEELCVPSLYLAYNKAMADEAKNKFPSWVTVKTTHALAFGVHGRALVDKLKRPSGAYENVCGTGSEIARYFRVPALTVKIGGMNKTIVTSAGIGRAIRETVNAFEYSADDELAFKHISHSAVKDKDDVNPTMLNEYRKVVLETAKRLWKLRINVNSNILATHDTYLKLYQLSKPDLSGYEILYLDEGQDTNECVLDIILRQTKPKIVVVGDQFQQIYQFRGSVNAMQNLPFKESALTQSFRFGQAIADVANAVLSHDGSISTNLRGWDKVNSKVVDMFKEDDAKFTYTVLYRTNMALVLDAVHYLSKGKRVNLEIDVKDFVKLLESAMELKNGNMPGVKHDELLPYTSWFDFSEEVAGKGSELARVHTIITDGDFFKVVGMLKTQKNVDHPDIILTTAHKSKGREFDVVLLASDFPGVYNNKGEWCGLHEAERNLLYVAVTRARKLLVTNKTVRDILERLHIPREELAVVNKQFDEMVSKMVSELEHDMKQDEDSFV
jgi:adenylate kinase